MQQRQGHPRVDAYRSALTTVFLHSTLPAAVVEMIRSQCPRAERPLRLEEAVEVLKPGAPEPSLEPGAPATYPSRARQVAAGFLAEGYFVRGRRFLDAHLATLLDGDRAVDGLRALYSEETPPSGEDLTRATFGLPRVAAAPEGGSGRARGVQTALDFDPETLATTVTATVTTTLGFDTLALLLDPRAWALSMFWREAYRVVRAGDTTPLGNPQEPPGCSWRGPFFEFFEFNWSPSSPSSFQNFLDIRYEVDRRTRCIDMDFSLHSSRGAFVSGVESTSGIDVDSGSITARPVRAAVSGERPRWAARARARTEPRELYRVTSRKKLRFTELLPELPPTPDFLGRGLLVLLTPSLLTLWLREMVAGIYLVEKRHQDDSTLAGREAPAGRQ